MSMYPEDLEKIKSLDEIRLENGIDRLKAVTHDLIDNNFERAIELINDKSVLFPSLFVLRSEIIRYDIIPSLSIRNRYALKIVNKILSRDIPGTQRLSFDYREEDYYVLKWILETGYLEDGLNDQYGEVLETAAIILAKIYKDRNCLRVIEEMIFNRNRRGTYIYDLVWAFFECSRAEDLIMLVNRLCSYSRKDVELARKLLNFIPCMGIDSKEYNVNQYQYSLKWIDQNRNFLYYTGESNLQTSNPHRYAISLEAKYLQKTASKDYGEPSGPLTEDQYTLLDNFKKLDDYSKVLLSNCSSELYRKSRYWWNEWLKYPIDKQIMTAGRIQGGSL